MIKVAVLVAITEKTISLLITILVIMIALRFWAWAIAHFRIWHNSDYARLVEKKAKKTYRKERNI